jgi:hypothetical protein
VILPRRRRSYHDETDPSPSLTSSTVFEIFEHESGGSEGVARRPSKATLENTLGTGNVNDAIEKILTDGEIKHGGRPGKHGNQGMINNCGCEGADGLVGKITDQPHCILARGNGTTTGGRN